MVVYRDQSFPDLKASLGQALKVGSIWNQSVSLFATIILHG